MKFKGKYPQIYNKNKSEYDMMQELGIIGFGIVEKLDLDYLRNKYLEILKII